MGFSPEVRKNARNIHSLLLRRIDTVGGSETAAAIGVSASTISRLKTDENHINLLSISDMLAYLDLQVYHADGESIKLPKDKFNALVVLAGSGVESMKYR